MYHPSFLEIPVNSKSVLGYVYGWGYTLAAMLKHAISRMIM